MKISMRFALDRNQNKTIEKEEKVNFSDLSSQDKNGDQILDRRELRDVYFEYGEDTWLKGGRRHRVKMGNQTHLVELQELKLSPPAMKMNINIRV